MGIDMKYFCYELTGDLYEQASRPIRKKEDVLSLLVSTIKVLVSMPVSEESSIRYANKVILFVDRMSRLFFCTENKIFTINFPFSVSVFEEAETLKVSYRHIEIDSYISSLIISVFEESETFSLPLDNMQEFVLQHMADNGWEDAELDDVCDIIKKLIIFETGYFRYDHDKMHANGHLHPEHHLDFYYESNNELKIGLEDLVDHHWMMDLANINTDCKYVK